MTGMEIAGIISASAALLGAIAPFIPWTKKAREKRAERKRVASEKKKQNWKEDPEP